ncbi:uncharacterized protein LOC114731715 [Neltuma alba]|uniref:uncharacterized protein LOC114731715 n=1 Tax=Neltuma alba TaxID=207710 RepID=UPI0010A2B26F|nr:uncharacterized protein LOC114731715 [Prosopis alba]
MMQTVFACLNRQVSDVKVGSVVEQAEAKPAVYRDELTKKQAPCRKAAVAVKKSVRFADSEPTILGGDELEKEKESGKRIISSGNNKREGIRVKVKMTREEAARLLSKCKEGGFLEFGDVARELVSIPVGRVSVVPTSLNKIEEATLDEMAE